MPGFRSCQRCGNRFIIPHFPYQNDIRILTQGRAQSGGKRGNIPSHLSLMDQRLLSFIHILNRILYRNDMLRPGGIHIVNHGRQGSGLTASRRPCYQYQPSRFIGQLFQYGRKLQLFYGGNTIIEQTDGAGQLSLLPENIHTFSSPIRRLYGKIHIFSFRKFLLQPCIRHLEDHLPGLFLSRLDRRIHQRSFYSYQHGQPFRQMNIRAACLPSHGNDCMNVHS